MGFLDGHAGDTTHPASQDSKPSKVTDSLTLPATLDNLQPLLDFIHTEVDKHHCPLSVRNKIDITFEEFFVNVCRYAYKGMEQPGLCYVEYSYTPNPHTITVQLTDWGVPFDPLTRKDPTRPSSVQEAKIGGLGILMAKKCADAIEYVHEGDKNVLVFKKSW
ncbi:MAG: ATP-binding protein [Coriobacteriales bacterium]|jgi:anti-sigma regulatory factor (Ser/Thr protein kinase)|nr:ATP-binding protein [Coriobacteriales bacterium]